MKGRTFVKKIFVKYKWLLIALLMISIIAVPMVVNILFKFSSTFSAEWSAGDALSYVSGLQALLGTIIPVSYTHLLDFARAIQKTDNYYVLGTREDLSTLPYSVNAILELKKTTSRSKRTDNKAYPIYDSLSASNVQLGDVEQLLTEEMCIRDRHEV